MVRKVMAEVTAAQAFGGGVDRRMLKDYLGKRAAIR